VKLLQFCNVASITGGTFGCVYSITKCLPDWEHQVIAMNCGNKEAPKEAADRFPGRVICKTPPVPQEFLSDFEPDALIFHNTHPNSIPVYIDPFIPKFYYQHSAARACEGAKKKCNIWWAVSKFLADKVAIDDQLVFYQPIPVPKQIDGRVREGPKLRIGRLCTPRLNKWDEKEIIPLYSFLSREHNDVHWDFVGCPKHLKDELNQAVSNRCLFFDASYEARSLMWTWDAILYDNRLVEESYGRVVCEAQRTGCIPIVSNLGGFKEQINHGQSGYLCETHEDFSTAIRYLKDSDLKKQVSSGAKVSGDLRGSLATWREGFLKWFTATLRVLQDVN